MLLRVQAVGSDPFLRFVISNMDDETLWNGIEFTPDFETSMKFCHPSDACFEIHRLMAEQYKHLPQKKYVAPVEIDVFGDVSMQEVAEFLHRATVLSVRAEEFGNGPKDESYVAPTIHWGYLKLTDGSVNKTTDDPAKDWGFDENSDQ